MIIRFNNKYSSRIGSRASLFANSLLPSKSFLLLLVSRPYLHQVYQKRPLNTSREGTQIPEVAAFADIKTDLPAICCSRRNCLLRECSDTQNRKTTGNMKFSVVFGTPGWIRTSGLQSRSHQAVKRKNLGAQWFCWFWANFWRIAEKSRRRCGTTPPRIFSIVVK